MFIDELLLFTQIQPNKESLNGIIGLPKDKNSSCINSIIQCLSNNKDFTK